MAAPDVPVWAQQIGALVGTVAVAGLAAWNERRKKHEPEPDHPAAIIAGTLMGAQSFDGIVKALEGLTRTVVAVGDQHHVDSRRVITAAEALEDEMKRLTAAVGEGAATPKDMIRLIHDLKDK